MNKENKKKEMKKKREINEENSVICYYVNLSQRY